MIESEALIFAGILDGRGGARGLSWPEALAWRADDGPIWMHLNREAVETRRYLESAAGIPRMVADALLAEETRPRAQAIDGGLLVILRGVNMNPGSDPEDMVSIRLWFEDKRVISTRVRRLLAAQDLQQALGRGAGPRSMGGLLVFLAERLTARVDPVIGDTEDRLDAVEERTPEERSRDSQGSLADIWRTAIRLRRYLSPQRDALSRIVTEPIAWLEATDRLELREVVDHVTRFVEELNAIHERALIAQEELNAHLNERMNRTIYQLSLIATIFLPLSFITGLLGINVGGIPGADDGWAFWVVCGLLAAIAAFQVWLFRRLRWV